MGSVPLISGPPQLQTNLQMTDSINYDTDFSSPDLGE